MGLTGKNNEQKIWNYLIGRGLSPAGAAGIMGNLNAESALKANNLEDRVERQLGMTDAQYTKAVDNGSYTNFAKDGGGYGLAQWTYHTRKAALKAYADARKASIADVEMQLDFLMKELSEGYGGLLNTLKTATSVQSASDAFLTQFERPANTGDAVKKRRAGFGQSYFNKYAGAATALSTGSSGPRYTAKKLIAIAVAEIGYHEKASNSNLDDKTANSGGNNWTKFARDLAAAGYYNGSKNGYAWCDVFVDWCFFQLTGKNAAKAQEIECQTGPLGAGCLYSRQYYQQQGRLSIVPQPGDQVFFQQGGNIVHTGIVETVSGSTITTIEGNSSDQVARRSYSLSNSYVKDFGHPKFDTEDDTPTTQQPSTNTEVAYTVKPGDTLSEIAARYGTTYQALAQYNKIENPNVIQVGQVIHIPGKATPGTGKSWKIGDVVNFTGNIHYVSSNAARGVPCKSGKATITGIYPSGDHPYHLIRVSGSGATVYGWVDADSFTDRW